MPVKFRCFACNQLLGVSRSKVGSVVACPRCAAELIVPPDPEVEIGTPASASGETPAIRTDPTPPFPALDRIDDVLERPGVPDLEALGIDLRPEDIMAEPGVRGSMPIPPPPPPPPPPPWPAPPEFAEIPAAEAVEADELPVASPPIEVAPAPIAPEAGRAGRSRDVSIPRAAFLAWSLFVLFALALAFGAGLLVGRFLWAPAAEAEADAAKKPAGRKP